MATRLIFERDLVSMLLANHLLRLIAALGSSSTIFIEAYLERDDALGRERYLKSGSGRKFLKTQLRHYLSKEPLS